MRNVIYRSTYLVSFVGLATLLVPSSAAGDGFTPATMPSMQLRPRWLSRHVSSIAGIDISPDGTEVATIDHSGWLRVWERVPGLNRRYWRAHSPGANDVIWHPAGTLIATCSEDDRTIKLFDAATGLLVRSIDAMMTPYSVAMSPDGSEIASAGMDGRIEVFRTQDGSHRSTITVSNASAGFVDWSRDGRYLACIDGINSVRVVDSATGINVRSIDTGLINSTATFDAGSTRIAIGTTTGVLRVYDLAGGTQLFTANAHSQKVAEVEWSPDGVALATVGYDRKTSVRNAATYAVVRDYGGPTDQVFCTSWTIDSTFLASGSRDFFAFGWANADDSFPDAYYSGHAVIDTSSSLTPVAGGNSVISAAGQAIRYDVNSGLPVRYIGVPEPSRYRYSSASNDGTFVALGNGQLLTVASGETGAILWTANTGNPMREIYVTPDGSKVIACLAASSRSYDATTGSPLWTVPHHAGRSMDRSALAPDGSKLAVGLRPDIQIIDVVAGVSLGTIMPGGYATALTDLDWSPSLSLLAMVQPTRVDVVSASNGVTINTVTMPARGCDWSPDSRRLAIHQGSQLSIFEPIHNRISQRITLPSSRDIRDVVWTSDRRLVYRTQLGLVGSEILGPWPTQSPSRIEDP